jgi:type I restriction enzyme S subunit
MSKAWPILLLGEVLKERREIPSVEALAKGEIRIVAKIGFNDGKIQLRNGSETKTGMILVRPGDLLISGINAAKGAIAIYGEENTDPIAATIHYGAYITKKDRVDVKYLWWLLRSRIFRDLLERYVPGGIKTELKAKRLLPIPVPLPSLEEQWKIVAKIDEIASKVEEARRLRHQATEESKAIPRALADVVFRDIKTRIQLGEGLFDLIYRYPTFYNIVFIDKGVGLLKVSNLTQEGWKIQFDNPRDFISQETNQRFQRTILEAGDVVMAARGATIGKTAYVTEEFAGFNINPNLLRLKPNAAKLEGKYFWYFMCSNLAQNQFQALVTSTAKQTITVPKLKSIYIPLPPVAEQCRIVAYLDGFAEKVEALKGQQNGTAAEIDAFLPSILDKAFKGEL